MVSRLINILTWLLVAGSVAIILGGLLGRPVLVAAVPTTSMVPVLSPGDMIPVLPMWGAVPQQGQIIVFKTEQDETWIVHRVVGGNTVEGFITKGDANPIPDQHRVFPQNVAGFVPTVGGTALHIPKLGSLSLGRSPMSSPVVAGTALVMGVYLLVTDAGSGLRQIRLNRMKRFRPSRLEIKSTFHVYFWLAVLAFLATTITNFSMTTEQKAIFSIVASKNTKTDDPRISVLGRPVSEDVVIHNPSMIPVVIGLSSSDPDLVWEPSSVVIGPLGQRHVRLTRLGTVLGNHTAVLRKAVYLPLLPPTVILALASVNWHWPIFATALVPVLVVLAVAVSDPKARHSWRTFTAGLYLRLGTWKG